MLQELAESAVNASTLCREVINLNRKVDKLIQLNDKVDELLHILMTAKPKHSSKKHLIDEASITTELPPVMQAQVNTGTTDTTQYIVRAKEPSILLSDNFDENPKNLKKFLMELDLC